IEPPVSEPSATGVSLAATAAADPPLVPPGERSTSHGLRTGPNAEVSFDDPIANSSQLVLPTTIAPAASRRVITVASYGGTNPASMRDDAVVWIPRVQMLSLIAIGTAASGASRQRSKSRSSAAARARARSAAMVLNAFSSGFTPSIRASASLQISAADLVRERNASTSAPAVVCWLSTDDAGHAEEPGVDRRVGRVRQRGV